MNMQTYTTTCVTWDDGEYETTAMTPAGAAIEHATEGWENDEIDANPDADEPPIGPREPVEIKVTDHANGSVTHWRVRWNADAGRAAAEAV